jgi:hypothetical protein
MYYGCFREVYLSNLGALQHFLRSMRRSNVSRSDGIILPAIVGMNKLRLNKISLNSRHPLNFVPVNQVQFIYNFFLYHRSPG